MGKINRGKTIKLSIRMSEDAKEKADRAAKRLGISTGGVILFELTKLLENPPSRTDILNLENTIELSPKHFVMTVNVALMDRINKMSEDYNIKKNILIGYLVSEHFENMDVLETPVDNEKPKQIMVQIHEDLKKKMIDYSEENYIPLNALITYSILEGPYMEKLPSYEEGEMIQIFTKAPNYISDLVKDRAADLNIREHFYKSLCIYKQFMTPEGRFFENEKATN